MRNDKKESENSKKQVRARSGGMCAIRFSLGRTTVGGLRSNGSRVGSGVSRFPKRPGQQIEIWATSRGRPDELLISSARMVFAAQSHMVHSHALRSARDGENTMPFNLVSRHAHFLRRVRLVMADSLRTNECRVAEDDLETFPGAMGQLAPPRPAGSTGPTEPNDRGVNPSA